MNELEALAVLTSIPYLGSIKIQLLLRRFGSALAALQAPLSDIADLPDFGPKIMTGWSNWQKNAEWKQNLALAEKHDVELVPCTSSKYPKQLLDVPDHPILLYVQGQLLNSDKRSIAVIGTRNASIYGNEMAEKFARDLGAAGFTVISGLARGIDTSAHRAALMIGRTIAVIGSGLANIYPQENKELAKEIAKRGALISEFPMATPPDRQNFPQRNRIVSGMTLATLLIEAPLKSGAMITVERTLDYRKLVFALPGRIDNGDFKGNHLLIKNRRAILVEDAQEIISNFEELIPTIQPARSTTRISLCEEERTFLSQLPNHEVAIDDIVQLTQLPVRKVNILVMSLTLKKVLKEFPGKVYKKHQFTD